MRHRKKLFVAALLLVATYTVWCLWPHSNSRAVRLLTEWRGLVLQRDGTAAAAVSPSGETGIHVSLVIAKINMTDATAGLLAKSADGSRFDCGYIRDQERMAGLVDELGSLGVLDVIGRPQMAMSAGQTERVLIGANVPLMTPGPAGAKSVPVAFRTVGTCIEATPQLCADGMIRLRLNCAVEWVENSSSTANVAPGIMPPRFNTGRMRTVVQGEVRPGEALIVGGLTKKWEARKPFRLPLLSDLPGIGEWFHIPREGQIEEELVILATPRIVGPKELVAAD